MKEGLHDSLSVSYYKKNSIDLLHKSHNAPAPYPTMHHFVTEMRADSRFAPSQWETALLWNVGSHWLVASLESALEVCTCMHISVTEWCITEYLPDTSWDMWDGTEQTLWPFQLNVPRCSSVNWNVIDMSDVHSCLFFMCCWNLLQEIMSSSLLRFLLVFKKYNKIILNLSEFTY